VFETEDFPPEVMPAEAAASEIATREELQRRYTSR